MRCLPLAVALLAWPVPGPAGAGEPDPAELLARRVAVSALVFGPEGSSGPAPLAGALVLDPDKRLLLAPNAGVPDDPTAVFPAHTPKGELRNAEADYIDLWKKGERWAGRVRHRDKRRDLAVIELDQALPDQARAAEFAGRPVRPWDIVYSLNQPEPGGDKMWALRKGTVRFVGPDIRFPPGSDGPAKATRVVATAPRQTGPDCGLFDGAGRVVGFVAPPDSRPAEGRVSVWLDVTEVQAFLTDKKVPFRTAPEPAGKGK